MTMAGSILAEVLREYVLLSLPMQQICKDRVQGDVPAMRAQQEYRRIASVETKVVDERWTALRDLKVGTPKQ